MWALGVCGFWLYPAVRSHLAAGSLTAAALTLVAIWIYGAMYYPTFALVFPWLPRPLWLSGPAAWVLLEEVRERALWGAPWGLLGHSQHAVLPLAQLAELTGVTGLSFLIVMPAAALTERGSTQRRGLAAAVGATAIVCLFGAIRLRSLVAAHETGSEPSVRVLGGHNLAADPLGNYLAATALAQPAALTVWPEAALPGYLQDDASAAGRIAAAARERGWLLVGTPRHEGRGRSRRYFNSAVLLDPTGRLRATYDKRRLVPFAERSPPLFASVPRPFSPGTEGALPLAAGQLRIGPLICWEVIFPELARRYVRQGVDVLVNLTSDRDLGAGAEQLLAFSRFRAIETRRWLVRASGVEPPVLIDPAGRIAQEATLGVAPRGDVRTTFYARHGEVLPWASAALLVLLVSWRMVRTKMPRVP